MIKKYTIYGERCSGTNYLENIMNINFNVKITWEYGWKHFFGHQDESLKNADDTLFICIVRNLPDWINSLYRTPHHIPEHLKRNIRKFLNEEIYSIDKNEKEIMNDRNMYTGERYKNIYELRHTKMKWMVEELPKKVKNYIYIRYEDLINEFEKTLEEIKNKGLEVKKEIVFPINTDNYKNTKNTKFKKKQNEISTRYIMNNTKMIPLYEDARIYEEWLREAPGKGIEGPYKDPPLYKKK